MSVCEHEYENANCTNCANGLPSSAYECAKTKGALTLSKTDSEVKENE